MTRLVAIAALCASGCSSLLAGVCLVLSACLATSLATSKQVHLRNGEPALQIECNYSKSNCAREARKKCPHGYTVLDEGDKSSAFCPPHTGETPPEACESVLVKTLYVRCNDD